MRASIAPGALIAELRRFIETDIRSVLPTVSAPTIVLVETEENESSRSGRFAAERIPGARFEEIPDVAPLNWLHWYGRADGILRSVARLFWLNLQAAFDLEVATRRSVRQIERDVHPREAA